MSTAISLYELNKKVSQVVASNFSSPLWITAEIAQLSTPSNGHCYLDLVEKDPETGAVSARARAMVWANRWWLIRETFQQGTGQSLTAGLKVMIEVQVSMHESYGYSLVIQNIEPNYTLGEMQRRRQEIIQRLTQEGMIDVNRSLTLPRPAQRIAIISAENAAGYGDFCHQLKNNEYGIPFYLHLFPAALQGEQTEASVIQALDRIHKYEELFDAVVIIRGGGSVIDLSSFDSYELALNIANFPLPVIVGIGHERDSTVLDIVAHTSVKTPTAAAAFLIELAAGELSLLEELKNRLCETSRTRIEHEQVRLDRMDNAIRGTHIRLGQQVNQLELIKDKLQMLLRLHIEREGQRLDYYEKTTEMAKPDNILARGYSITRQNGKVIKDISHLHIGDCIETQTATGVFTSKVEVK